MAKELAEIGGRLERAQRMCLDEAMSREEFKVISAPLKCRRVELEAMQAEVDEARGPNCAS